MSNALFYMGEELLEVRDFQPFGRRDSQANNGLLTGGSVAPDSNGPALSCQPLHSNWTLFRASAFLGAHTHVYILIKASLLFLRVSSMSVLRLSSDFSSAV